SDRVNSVLVPKSFLQWANASLGQVRQPGASRVFIKTRDANDAELLDYFEKSNFYVNKEKTKFGRQKNILEGILTGLGVFGLLMVLMSLLIFSFYLQLVIARSRDSLQLLLLIGYSPGWLSNKVSRQFIPVYFLTILASLGLTQLMQWAFHQYGMHNRPELNTLVHPVVIILAGLLILLSILANHRLVKKQLYRLY
ncbi:MAG TPA: FtsX-like permease family protein, partial [Flavisolibacter sp.]|nr:FtsX-like permease family protein [Flavisolibacter sp.]